MNDQLLPTPNPPAVRQKNKAFVDTKVDSFGLVVDGVSEFMLEW